MWLLNTETLQLELFNSGLPKYAILSHRWQEPHEMNFENVNDPPKHLAGYQKVKRFCELAREMGYDYAWADTCCIDKKSSTELSEAINSMYSWYRDAEVCIAYMVDVRQEDDFAKSAWFTRGWTLQELIAPPHLLFFDLEWKPLGSKRDRAAEIELITKIPRSALEKYDISAFGVAQRMSWAANRVTTREEDRAYSLLGILGVNMPMLYGEGTRAFQRLQEEIMRTSTDSTIFQWHGEGADGFGMLAQNPSCFSTDVDSTAETQASGNASSGPVHFIRGWTVTNAGMNVVSICLQAYRRTGDSEIFFLPLDQGWRFTASSAPVIGIFVERLHEDVYRRVSIDNRTCANLKISRQEDVVFLPSLFIRRVPIFNHETKLKYGFRVKLTFLGSMNSMECLIRPRPNGTGAHDLLENWPVVQRQTGALSELQHAFLVHPDEVYGILGHLLLTIDDAVKTLICLGFDRGLHPICVVIPFCTGLYPKLHVDAILDQFRTNQAATRADFDKEVLVLFMAGNAVSGLKAAMPGLDITIHRSQKQGEDGVTAVFNLDAQKLVQTPDEVLSPMDAGVLSFCNDPKEEAEEFESYYREARGRLFLNF